MKRRLFWWETAGFLFVGAMGTLLHFLYEWSGNHPAAAVISGVNESTGEHIKLLVVPLFLFSVVQFFLMGRVWPNLLAVRAVSMLTGAALIPVFFYTYSGILGRSVSWVNISIFFAADLLLFLLDARLLRQGRLSAAWQQILGLLVLWGLLFCVVWCTFRPPQLALWRDPVTGRFGIV